MTRIPLLGDSEGRYKVHIIGNSGTGKSTTGIELAQILGVPYISLDRLFWNPGWQTTQEDEFKAKILVAMAESDKGWVIDGNYQRMGARFVTDVCTDLIWLDPPLLLYFPRVFVRTMRRLIGQIPTCSPGCEETLRGVFFSSDSILWWTLSHHWSTRAKNRALMAQMELETNGNPNLPSRKMTRLGGWGGERKAWLESVAEMFRTR